MIPISTAVTADEEEPIATTSMMMTANDDGVLECRVGNVMVQKVPASLLEDAEYDDFDWCNTCNHHTALKLSFFDGCPAENNDSTVSTQDKIAAWEAARTKWRAHYQDRIQQTQMDKWFPILGDLCGDRCKNATVLTITPQQQQDYFRTASTVAEAGACGRLLLSQEATELAAKLLQGHNDGDKARRLQSPPSQGWFVRTSACSPKDALQDGGAGPHHSLENVLLALMASDRVHRCIDKRPDDDMVVYLMPFDDEVTIAREVRVFVHENRVTSMSQYGVTSSSVVFASKHPAELADLAKAVVAFHETEVRPRWTVNKSYTMDVEVCQGTDGTNEPTIRLLELNSFGAEMAAASALFHWERDRDILYGTCCEGKDKQRTVCIRVRE